MLCLALLMEILQWWTKRTDLKSAISISLNVSLLASLFAVGTGWFLSEEGGYDADLLFWHKWMGIGMTTVLALICGLRWKKRERATLPLLFVVVMLLSGAGHFGGSITHGENYLFMSGVEEAVVLEKIQEAEVYSRIIQPILKKKCMSCHNPSKQKGGLLMTTIEGMKAGGEKGKLLDFDYPMKSALLTRIHLPKSEEEHMPPSGKKQLTDDEIVLLEWWLKNRACFDCKVSDIEEQGMVADILEKYKGTRKSKLKELPKLEAGQLASLSAAGIAVYSLSVDNPYVIVNLSGNKELSKKTFKSLAKIGEYVLELNVQNSNFSDQLANWLPSFPQLQKLQVQNTVISNKSISTLEELEQLESLNIYGTAITDEAILGLEKITSLKRLYCWQSKMTEAGVQRLQKSKPLLDIQYQLKDDIFGGAILNEPSIYITSDLFVDTVHVRLKSDFRGVSIFYTLDGTVPDTTSILYQDSIHLAQPVVLKTYCYKEGWERSMVKEVGFHKAGLPFKSAKLSKPPSDDYKGKGGKTLIDGKHGTSDLKDGNWLGYEGENMSFVAELDSAQQITEVALRAMSSPGPWLFFPKGLKVSTSIDGKKYKLAGEEKYKIEQRDNFRLKKYFKIDFEPREVRYVKVEVTGHGKLPDWHPNVGEGSWLFIDEVSAKYK
jgi:uncharacterized membrane protein